MTKSLKEFSLIFLLNPVPFNRQSYQEQKGSETSHMVAAPIILGEDLNISDRNNWGELSKKLNLGGAKCKGGPKILGGGGL